MFAHACKQCHVEEDTAYKKGVWSLIKKKCFSFATIFPNKHSQTLESEVLLLLILFFETF